MLKAKGIVKQVGPKTILQGINLEIRAGECVAILGPNGAGKSTLLKILATLMKPSAGVVYLDGKDAWKRPEQVRGKIGLISHQSLLYDNLTARENLLFYGKMLGLTDLDQRVWQLLKEVGLLISAHEQVQNFSRGMQQRLALARAILHNPPLLFLDEPFTGLDQQGIGLLNNLIGQAKTKGTTLIMVTHSFEEGLAFSDRVLVLNKGGLVYTGESKDLSITGLRDLYCEMTGVKTS